MGKHTTRIGMKAARTLYYAEEQASRIGWPLNTSITLNLASLGIGLEDASVTFARLRNQRFAPWVRRPNKARRHWSAPPTYSYGFENARDGVAFEDPHGEHNVHVHWAVHVPQARSREFEDRLHDWVSEIVGSRDWPENAMKIRQITDPGQVAKYPIKGAAKMVAVHFGVAEQKIAGQGLIIGKRTGTTQNIGPSARRKADRDFGISRLNRMHLGRNRRS